MLCRLIPELEQKGAMSCASWRARLPGYSAVKELTYVLSCLRPAMVFVHSWSVCAGARLAIEGKDARTARDL